MTTKNLLKPILLILCVAVIVYAFLSMGEGRGPIVYSEHLQDTAVSIDGNSVTFEDLAFYILYEERKVEEQARIYNPDSTKDYWNIHTNDTFLQGEAKDVVMGMAIHDHLFYQLAVEEGLGELTLEEEKDLEYRITDFWEDMLDIQREKLPCEEKIINNQIRLAAIAEKYQNKMAEQNGPSQAAYKYDGYYYQQIRDEHQIEINEKLWKKFVLGDVTLKHSTPNYINGLTDEDKEKIKTEKKGLRRNAKDKQE